jgi:NAD(P)-dependent dehydrogenase (short-subunit alcohol dehydrogenase family)
MSSPLFNLSGKAALVTGGSKGLGKAMARGFAEAGADVFISSRNADELKAATAEIGAGLSVKVEWMVADMADRAAVKALAVEAEQRLGKIDILVNNAGIAIRKNAFEITREEWDRVIAVNQTGLFLCSRAAARAMKQHGGGAIVNLASIMGFSGGLFPNPAYQASKGAVVNLTRALALEFAEHNIRVNAVAPTFVRTDLTTPIFSNPEVLKKVMEHTPLGRLPEVEDIAQAILFLASPAARCITGVTLPVDSGYLAR